MLHQMREFLLRNTSGCIMALGLILMALFIAQSAL